MTTTPVGRRVPAPPLKPYIAIGYVLAGKLPAAQLEFPNVLITHASTGRGSRPPRRPALEKPDRGDSNIAEAWPPDLRVYSQWRIACRVDARDADEAHEVVLHRVLPPIVIALSEESEHPAFVEITSLGVERPDGSIVDAASPWEGMTIRGYEPEQLDSAASARAIDTAALIGSDDVARAAARDFAEATRLQHMGGSLDPVVRASLLHFFFVIEGIAREVGRGADADRFTAEQDRVASRLAKTLANAPSAKKAAAEIEKAARALAILERRHLRDQINATGDELNLDRAVVQEALTFANLRNKHLGHATRGGTRPLRELDPVDAEKIARAFLFGYINKRHAKGAT